MTKAQLFTLIISFIGFNLQAQDLQKHFRANKINLADSPAYSGDFSYFNSNVFSAQIAKWKTGYVVSYVTHARQSRLFFTNAQFEKQGAEIAMNNRIILQIVTDNNEIALLTGDRITDDDNEVMPFATFFTKVNEQGKVLLEERIVGADKIKLPGQSMLDDWGDYLMQWTGKQYLAFFPIQHNFSKFGKPDIHQGDCAYFISPEGEMRLLFDWGVSHSFGQRLSSNERYAALISRGDAYPRGLNVHFLSTQIFQMEKIDLTDRDPHNSHVKQEYYSDLDFECVPFEVSGKKGDNYVPFHLGDVLFVDTNTVLVGFSTLDKRKTYDIGTSLISAIDDDNCATSLNFITNTDGLSEHSMRMCVVGENRVLVLWKQFDVAKSEKTIAAAFNESDDEASLYQQLDLDTHMACLVDFTGKVISQPTELKNINWHNTANYHESKTEWHGLLGAYGLDTYSPIIDGHNGQKVWVHHRPKTKELTVYRYTN